MAWRCPINETRKPGRPLPTLRVSDLEAAAHAPCVRPMCAHVLPCLIPREPAGGNVVHHTFPIRKRRLGEGKWPSQVKGLTQSFWSAPATPCSRPRPPGSRERALRTTSLPCSPENAPFLLWLLLLPPPPGDYLCWQERLVLGAGFSFRGTSSEMHDAQHLVFLDQIHASSAENALTCSASLHVGC